MTQLLKTAIEELEKLPEEEQERYAASILEELRASENGSEADEQKEDGLRDVLTADAHFE